MFFAECQSSSVVCQWHLRSYWKVFFPIWSKLVDMMLRIQIMNLCRPSKEQRLIMSVFWAYKHNILFHYIYNNNKNKAYCSSYLVPCLLKRQGINNLSTNNKSISGIPYISKLKNGIHVSSQFGLCLQHDSGKLSIQSSK